MYHTGWTLYRWRQPHSFTAFHSMTNWIVNTCRAFLTFVFGNIFFTLGQTTFPWSTVFHGSCQKCVLSTAKDFNLSFFVCKGMEIQKQKFRVGCYHAKILIYLKVSRPDCKQQDGHLQCVDVLFRVVFVQCPSISRFFYSARALVVFFPIPFYIINNSVFHYQYRLAVRDYLKEIPKGVCIE